MDALRLVFNWISRHRILSFIAFAVVISAISFFRFVAIRSEGQLSDPLRRGKIVEAVYGIGTVTANKSFQIKLGVISTINELYVKEGDSLRKGEKIAKIDQVIFRAPFDSTVTFLPYKVGENVFASVPILTLVDLQDRYLVVSLEQQGALRVEPGQKVRMSFDTIREQNYDGVVRAVYSNDNNFLARIDISSLPRRILPGMTADVAITIRTRDDVLLIPIAAIENGTETWVKKSRRIPKRVSLEIGIVDKAMAEVVSGDLKEGDRVIIRKKVTP